MSALDDAWTALEPEATRLSGWHLRDLFAADPNRFDNLSLEVNGILADFSKEKLDQSALSRLFDLARRAGLPDHINRLFAGEVVNESEGRAALHMALRDGVPAGTTLNGVEVLPLVKIERDRMLAFCEGVRSGQVTSLGGVPFRDVINIGIGGSDLGAAMAVRALKPWHDGPRVHFLSNVDGAAFADMVRVLDPKRTLVVIASKSFSTLETMTNARSARAWLQEVLGSDVGQHLVAISTDQAAVSEFGITPERTFGFWDWVGGRYSIWSSVGLPLAIAIGADAFNAFLGGAKEMDHHFRNAPLLENLPVLFGLVGVWRRNAMGCGVTAVVPYEDRLVRLPAFLQQLDMESNGKRVSSHGKPVSHATGGVIFGEPGTNGQHSFFQLLHQGTDVIPVDFLVGLEVPSGSPGHHSVLFASALAQASALAFGRSSERPEDAHREYPGDRPSTMLIYDRLDPATLGALLALFEHRVFVQSVIWGINAFDQWGVELGKELAENVIEHLDEGALEQFDSSTAALIRRYRARR